MTRSITRWWLRGWAAMARQPVQVAYAAAPLFRFGPQCSASPAARPPEVWQAATRLPDKIAANGNRP